MSAALDHLAAQKPLLSQTNFKALEKALGLTYDHCAVLYSEYRAMLNFPNSRFTDWFHDLLASGGVYQIVVNEIVLDILEGTAMTCKDIDLFQASISFPDAKLNKTFFQDRIVETRGAHLKGFASETITAVQAICFLFTCVFAGVEEFSRQARLASLARESLEILLSGDKAVRLADRLDAVLNDVQTLLVSLYPWATTPKLHLMRHIKEGLQCHQLNMSCGGGERKHKRTKQLGRFAYKHFNLAILKRTLKRAVDDLESADIYRRAEIEGKAKPLAVMGVQMPVWPRARIALTRLARGQVVHWIVNGARGFGLTRGIVQRDGKAYALVVALKLEASGRFTSNHCDELLVECSFVEGAAAFIAISPNTFDILQPLL